MIDPKDLRKGNLVALAHESNTPIVHITEIRSLGVYAEYAPGAGNSYYLFDELLPIKLNGDWLKKCGFVNSAIDREEYWTLEFNETEKFSYTDIGLRYGILGVSQYEWSKADHIIYVHQLQSLYYLKTNEELTFK